MDKASIHVSWVLGFISAAIYFGENFKETDVHAVKAFVDNYCKQKPIDGISQAVGALMNELSIK